jgi:integrase/recombinase XerD
MGHKQPIHLETEPYCLLLQEYDFYINTLGYSKNGIESKTSNLQEFLLWLEAKEIYDITTVKTIDVTAYHEYLKNRPHKKLQGVLSLTTVNHHMYNLRVMFAMLQAKGDIIKNPMSILKYPNPSKEIESRTILTMDEVKLVYKAIETQQERAILALAYGCGLRSMEVVAMNLDDILWDADVIVVQKGKGNKRRVVPMSQQVKKDLEQYIKDERITYTAEENQKALLLNIKGVRLREYTCRKIVKRLMDRTNNEDITTKKIVIHHLRHSIATHLLEQGVPVEHVRKFLGHSQLETTQKYTRVSQYQLKDLMNLND